MSRPCVNVYYCVSTLTNPDDACPSSVPSASTLIPKNLNELPASDDTDTPLL